MWTLSLFTRLHSLLGLERSCALATYSRSTMLRVTLLLAGFYTGKGRATGEKEETTIAANDPALLAELLDKGWLERALRSTSAEPLQTNHYRQAPLSAESREKLLPGRTVPAASVPAATVPAEGEKTKEVAKTKR